MKNPPTPDPKPCKPGQPPDHNPKGDLLPVDPAAQDKLDPMDDTFLHGSNNKSK